MGFENKFAAFSSCYDIICLFPLAVMHTGVATVNLAIVLFQLKPLDLWPLFHSQGVQWVACDVSLLTLNDISSNLISTQLRWSSVQMPQGTAPKGPRKVFIFQRDLKPTLIAYKIMTL